ncbi:putative tetratricopeptide-like helical domain superfamily [Helianthus annuus]|nr:putative tetratricopeptide-like helical domain superfamily [Helianthus annuus]
MPKGYAQNSSISDGFSFFCRMLEDGVQPVVYNFTYLLKGCGENNYVREGKEVHAQVILNGHEGDVYVMTCVVNMYAKCRLVEDAYKMLSEGLRPDPVTVISILPAVGNVGDLRVGKAIHGYVFKSGYERHGNVATALVDMYLKCGCLSTGRVIFDKMSCKNVVSWNIMIDGYAQNGDYAEALSLFEKMLDNGFKPTGVTVMAALHACADSGEPSKPELVQVMKARARLYLSFVFKALVRLVGKFSRSSAARA